MFTVMQYFLHEIPVSINNDINDRDVGLFYIEARMKPSNVHPDNKE